jgi:bifunctional non-homologous end joining protein LigD
VYFYEKLGYLFMYMKKNKRKVWSESEIDFLVKNYSEMFNSELVKILDRSELSIYVKANKLGLSKSSEHKSRCISKRNKMVGRNLTNDALGLIAKEYKTKTHSGNIDVIMSLNTLSNYRGNPKTNVYVFGGYSIIGWNARRGSPLKPQPKTSAPVPYDEAKVLYSQLVASKLAKGYQLMSGSAGGQYSSPAASQKIDTGIYPELPIAIKDESLLEQYFVDPNFWMQPKRNVQHRPLKRDNCEYIGTNKKGFQVPISDAIKIAMAAFKPLQFVIDTEEEPGEKIIAFDLLENGRDYRGESYERRLSRLTALFESAGIQDRITLIETAKTEAEKRALFARLKQEGKEGVVIKDKRAVFSAGYSGSMFKFKFLETTSCIVTAVNKKRSVAIGLYQGVQLVSIGNVTIPPNHEVPKENEIVEVEYLYYYPGGSLFHPVYLGVRNDVDSDECSFEKQKLKEYRP